MGAGQRQTLTGRLAERSGKAGVATATGRGAERHQGGTQLRRSLPLAQRDPAVHAIFCLEHRRVWLCTVAAFDPAQRYADGDG
ncbi:hypothetical protein D3C80_2132000 [compost metagenome]